jgi:hypothetical protein
MSVLLVEVLADSLPCQLPPSKPFDKELLILSESSFLPAHLRADYVAVSDCLEFIRSPHTKLVIRTSSELFRGIIAGTLYANYKLTISSDRPDLYLRMLPTAQIYSSQPTAPEKPKAIPMSPETPSPAVPPRESSVSTEFVSEEAFQKLCNLYLNNVASSQRVRATTLAGAKEQILAVLNGMFVKSVPQVKNKDKVAQMLLEAMVRGDFLRVEGLSIVYNHQLLSHKPIHYRLGIPPEPLPQKPDVTIKILKANPLYVRSCNIYLNSYLCSARLRSTNVDQAKTALAKIVRESNGPQPGVHDFTEAIFNSFQASGYFSVKANQITYNLAKCKCKSLDASSVPSPHTTPYQPQSTPSSSQEAPQVEPSAQPQAPELHTHISEIVLMVMARVDSLGTMAQVMRTIQEYILEYEAKHQVVLQVEEVETAVQTVLEFLADNGFCAQDYPTS